MADLPGTTTVLIVDSDVAFAWWLGEIFMEAGSRVVPALNCTQAVSITKKLGITIQLIVVNPRLRGVSQMLRTLRNLHRSLTVVAIGEGNDDAVRTVRANAAWERPSGWEPISRPDWLDRVRGILRAVQAADAG